MSTFIGNIEGRLDEKGRIFVPAVYRKILAEDESKRIVMRRDTDNECLMFYPEHVWNEKVEQLRQNLDEWDPEDQLILMRDGRSGSDSAAEEELRDHRSAAGCVVRRHAEPFCTLGTGEIRRETVEPERVGSTFAGKNEEIPPNVRFFQEKGSRRWSLYGVALVPKMTKNH